MMADRQIENTFSRMLRINHKGRKRVNFFTHIIADHKGTERVNLFSHITADYNLQNCPCIISMLYSVGCRLSTPF